MKSAVCKHASVMINLRNLFRNDFTTLLARLALLYILWALCRVMFYLTNHLAIGPLSWAELPGLLHGALAFDTVSILYVNALFILLSLLPFRFRERPGYRRALKILFLTVNILALLVNVADGVYFRNARKRFTSDEFSYLSNNDNNLPVVLKAIGENWWAAVVVRPAGGVADLRLPEDQLPTDPYPEPLGLFRGQSGAPIAVDRTGNRRHPGRFQPPNPPHHPEQRHAIHLVEHQSQPHPEQSVLYPADSRQPLDHLHQILRPSDP